MKSTRPKVLHEVANLSMLGHALASVLAGGADSVAVVVGPGHESVAAEARARATGVSIFVQEQRRGTAHAVLAAREALAARLRRGRRRLRRHAPRPARDFARLREAIAAGAAVAALGFEAADPTGYGRLLVLDGSLQAIREHKDATPAEREVTLCNAGLIALDGRHALDLLDAIGDANASSEFYLTDVVAVARSRGLSAVALTAPEEEVLGVNDRVQLARAEAALQHRLREPAMRDGATLVAPETVYFSHDTVLGRDVVVEPHVIFGPKVRVAAGAVIHAFSHLEGAALGEGRRWGRSPAFAQAPGSPSARAWATSSRSRTPKSAWARRPTTSLISATPRIGAGANIGAGTITCNYDGFGKYRTVMGEKAFIGSNSALVAPVTMGPGAFVGSGSVVTEDVPADALALGRGRQIVQPGWATEFRARAVAKKAAAGSGH